MKTINKFPIVKSHKDFYLLDKSIIPTDGEVHFCGITNKIEQHHAEENKNCSGIIGTTDTSLYEYGLKNDMKISLINKADLILKASFPLNILKSAFRFYSFASVSQQPYNEAELTGHWEKFLQTLVPLTLEIEMAEKDFIITPKVEEGFIQIVKANY